LKISITEF